jgi:excisionase family DNA binding protein
MSARESDGIKVMLTVPDELLTALAERVAALAPNRGETTGQPESPWLDAAAAAAYIRVSRDQLYKLTAANAIPVRRKRRGQGLRFRREELDAWLEAEYESTGWRPRVELSSSADR